MTPEPLRRALASLDGLSVGDALGETFFVTPYTLPQRLAERTLPPPRWRWTDDTAMAQACVEVLASHGRVDQDGLAAAFAARYSADPRRGYGGMAHEILADLGRGVSWREAAGSAFDGRGSMGNGAAMRVAPVGAWFSDDPERVICEATASAEVTHANPEGIAGAVAVALAAAACARGGSGVSLLSEAWTGTPDGLTRDRLAEARELPFSATSEEAASRLGNGSRVLSWDTVPFALWCAARHTGDFVETFWATVAGLGDRDTTCAIACGVVAAGGASPPEAWRLAREPLDLELRGYDRS